MSVWFRHGDPRFPFLWESASPAPGRWHAADDTPTSSYADTTDGAWAELLRHEGITEPEDLEGITRRLWSVEIPDHVITEAVEPDLGESVLLGGLATYAECQQEARRLSSAGARALVAPSAALLPGGARGQVVGHGLHEADRRDGRVLGLFGASWPDVRGWAAVDTGRPTRRLLDLVRPLT